MYYYRINKLCIKLVTETSLHYDARSEKHQTHSKFCTEDPRILGDTVGNVSCAIWYPGFVHPWSTHGSSNILVSFFNFCTCILIACEDLSITYNPVRPSQRQCITYMWSVVTTKIGLCELSHASMAQRLWATVSHCHWGLVTQPCSLQSACRYHPKRHDLDPRRSSIFATHSF